MYRHKKINVLFSTADEIAFMFTPSLVMEDDEINYFFDSVEDAFEKGIRKIITEFITKQFSKTLHG